MSEDLPSIMCWVAALLLWPIGVRKTQMLCGTVGWGTERAVAGKGAEAQGGGAGLASHPSVSAQREEVRR